ncbi:MAG TPA: SDR family NAD(P)-dependent oxidoreductase [Solirubrobacteraceae bacterium]|nr:SDR family NAD(P)-dependent oxidoreductase [Solirubrobacteraceae bacterium]
MATTSHRPVALVTGASSGIGRALARELAGRGFDLILTGRSADALDEAARETRARGVHVTAVPADLATPDGVEEVAAQLAGRQLEVAAINAGIGSGGPFAETDLEQELELVDLNVRSTVHLAKRVVAQMVDAGRGRILFTSSIAATHPDPFEAVYGASKTFVQSFAKALRTELRPAGVTVTSLMPGPTETEFFHRANMDDTKIGASDSKDRAAEVARLAVEGMFAGNEQVVPGAPNKAITALSRVLPDPVKAVLHSKLAAPGSGR